MLSEQVEEFDTVVTLHRRHFFQTTYPRIEVLPCHANIVNPRKHSLSAMLLTLILIDTTNLSCHSLNSMSSDLGDWSLMIWPPTPLFSYPHVSS